MLDGVDVHNAKVEVGGAEPDGAILEAWFEDQGANLIVGQHQEIGDIVPCCEVVGCAVAVEHIDGCHPWLQPL